MDLPLETGLLVVGCHAAPAGTQVGVIIGAEKYVQNTVSVRNRSKKSAHCVPPVF